MKKQKHISEQGITLIELIVALAIGMTMLVAFTKGGITFNDYVSNAKNDTLARQYAQEGIDMVKYIHDTDPIKFATLIGHTYPVGDSRNNRTYNVSGYCKTIDPTDPNCSTGLTGNGAGSLIFDEQGVLSPSNELSKRMITIYPVGFNCATAQVEVESFVTYVGPTCTSVPCRTIVLNTCLADTNREY